MLTTLSKARARRRRTAHEPPSGIICEVVDSQCIEFPRRRNKVCEDDCTSICRWRTTHRIESCGQMNNLLVIYLLNTWRDVYRNSRRYYAKRKHLKQTALAQVICMGFISLHALRWGISLCNKNKLRLNVCDVAVFVLMLICGLDVFDPFRIVCCLRTRIRLWQTGFWWSFVMLSKCVGSANGCCYENIA